MRILAVLAFVMLLSVGAFAQISVDLTPVASDIESFVVSNLPVILGLVAISVGIPFVIKLLKRMAR